MDDRHYGEHLAHDYDAGAADDDYSIPECPVCGTSHDLAHGIDYGRDCDCSDELVAEAELILETEPPAIARQLIAQMRFAWELGAALRRLRTLRRRETLYRRLRKAQCLAADARKGGRQHEYRAANRRCAEIADMLLSGEAA